MVTSDSPSYLLLILTLEDSALYFLIQSVPHLQDLALTVVLPYTLKQKIKYVNGSAGKNQKT